VLEAFVFFFFFPVWIALQENFLQLNATWKALCTGFAARALKTLLLGTRGRL
jgi:hypothetical protein